MINSVEINIFNGPTIKTIAMVYFNENICLLNNNKYSINNEFKEELVRIIRTWKNEYGTSNNIDDQEFKVIVNADKKYTYHGKGIFPSNYQRLIEMIGDLNEW